MAWSSSHRRIADAARPSVRALMLAAGVVVATPALVAEQGVPASEREALVEMHAGRGGRPGEIDLLLRPVEEAGTRGLPVEPLTNKIREGLAKGVAPARIEPVVRQMAVHLETADVLVREVDPGSSPSQRATSVTLLAESFGTGVTLDEVRTIVRQTDEDGGAARLSPEALAGAAKSLSFIKDAGLAAADGSAVVVEASRRGYRADELIDLGRQVKRRERAYQDGRATLQALRDAIARGDRPDRLFVDIRPDDVQRPAVTRPDPQAARPETPARPGVPERPQTPERPQRPERPSTPQRP